MTLVKTSILSFISTFIKLLSGLVINKAVAVYIGPSGLAMIGQFQNFTQVALTAARSGILAGVVKYQAEYGKDNPKTPILLSTASKICLSSAVLVGAVTVLFSSLAATTFLKSDEYAYIFVIFGFTMVLFVVNGFLLSVLNGLKEIKTYISINIIQSLYSLIFTTILIVYLGLDGALIALVTNQSVVLIIVLYMLRKHPMIKLSTFRHGFDKPEAKKLMGFAMMSLTTAISIPVSHMLIRNHIGDTIGWDEAGYWQAIWYISTMYLMVVTTALNVYYMPKLSEIKEKEELRSELWSGYKIIMPIVMLMASGIFFLQDFIITILFSEDFSPMKELFLYQLIGDVIKMFSWLMAYLLLAKAMTKTFIASELVFSFVFVVLSILMIDWYGLIGVTYAFSISYTIYLVAIFFITRHLWADTGLEKA